MTRCYPKGNLVGGLRHLGFSPCRHPSYRALTFPLAGLSPAEQRQPLLDAQPGLPTSNTGLFGFEQEDFGLLE